MAKKILGYTQLRWTCPNCQTSNPGNEQVCIACGAPQPADVVFQKPEQQEMLSDEKAIARAKAGADIHCGFCGTRNPANASVCSRCGSDLTLGTQRTEGGVVGAYDGVKEVANWQCKNCGHENAGLHTHCVACGAPRVIQGNDPKTHQPETVQVKRKRGWLLPAIFAGLFLVAIIFVIMGLSRKEDLTGFVSGTAWQRSIAVESFGPVSKQDWREEIPSAANLGTCEYRFQKEQNQPAPQSTEVCGTPYMVDLGNGNAEIAQDCTYRVYAEFCQYTVNDWQVSDELVQKGANLNPIWPSAQLTENQRLGQQSEAYTIQFKTSDGEYEYKTGDSTEFSRFIPGSKWILTINSFGKVIGVAQSN
ncbi:MAG: hypothetical protein BGO78_07915 [Chloroflexi bacterium 44-23]|nr:MAG: hypothetical protein BGO78_07915 [Chloroflexi bacterium 44-23]